MGCTLNPTGSVLVVSFAIVTVSLGMYLAYITTEQSKDPYGIVREATLVFRYVGPLGVIGVQVILPHAFWNPGNLVIAVAFLLYTYLITPHQVLLSRGEDAKIQQNFKNRGTSINDFTYVVKAFDKMVQDPKQRGMFEDYLQAHYCYESLRFFDEANDWESRFFDMGQKTALSRANKLFYLFIREAGPMACNISSVHWNNLKKKLDSGEDIGHDVFHECRDEVKGLMVKDTFTLFLLTNDEIT